MDNVEKFIDELIAPYSVHRKKYERPHGTVARRELKNRMTKRLVWELKEAQRRGFYAGQANAGVSLNDCHFNYKLWDIQADDASEEEVHRALEKLKSKLAKPTESLEG